MNLKNIFLFIIVISIFGGCKKDSEESITNEQILENNAQAVMYFHTIFRESENAWAVVDSINYDPTNIVEEKVGSSYRKISYNSDTNTVTVEYNAWVSGRMQLGGKVYIKVPNRYKENGSTAAVTLESFSIQAQRVTGAATLTYSKVEGSETDHYQYKLTNGAIYHQDETQLQVLITANIQNGAYERTAGGNTVDQKNDLWAYTGTMTGLLYEDPNMSYTNNVLTSYVDGSGATQNGTVYYSLGCLTAKEGVAQIKTSGRSDITYQYDCSEYFYVSVTKID